MPPSKDAVLAEVTVAPAAAAFSADTTPLMRELSRLSKSQQSHLGFETSGFGEVVTAALRSSEMGFVSLPSLLPLSGRVAIDGDDEEEEASEGTKRPPTTYHALHHFVKMEFDLGRFGLQSGDTVGVVLPNGPELAVAVLACMSYVACAPINASNTHEETCQELLDVGAKAVLLRCVEETEKELASQLAAVGIIPIIVTTGCSIGLFRMEPYSRCAVTKFTAPACSGPHPDVSLHPDNPPYPDSDIPGENAHVIDVSPTEWLPFNPPSAVCLKLRTSGSTGLKKLVPTRLEDLVVAACCTSTVAGLSANDVGINVLPMFHVGGIHRNLLAPLLAGGHMVFMGYFEPHRFWALFQAKGATWYHGVPSIHSAIVDALLPSVAPAPSDSAPINSFAPRSSPIDRIATARYHFRKKCVAMRFVSNAGAALPHAQALELQKIYDTAVLPCYGMSECAAVAAPSLSYRLEKPGSVGRPIGPAVRIVGRDGKAMPTGEAGEIQVRGPPTFPGYISLATGKLKAVGREEWFSTGDMGKVDADGYLFLTGRSKEVINRGGEIISPIEVEEVFMKHPAIAAAAAFVVPHSTLQEAVGLMIVVKPGCMRPSKAQLQEWGRVHLGPPKWPVNIVYTPKLPLSTAGKMVRIGLAERLGLPENCNDTHDLDCHFEVISVPDANVHGNKAPIPSRKLGFDDRAVEVAVRKACPGISDIAAVEREVRAGVSALVVYGAPAEEVPSSSIVISTVIDLVHGYTLPSAVIGLAAIPRDPSTGAVDVSQLPDMGAIDYVPPRNKVEETIQRIWHEALGQESIGVHSDFFAIGGVSVQAGAVGYNIRATYSVPASGALLYDKRTIAELAEYVDMHLCGEKDADGKSKPGSGVRQRHDYFDQLPSASISVSSTHWAVQAVNWAVSPLVSLSTTFVHWVVLMVLICAMRQIIESRIVAIVVASALTSYGMSVYKPLLAIAVKWIVVGRFRPGRYPLWGSYYLRWWVADQFRRVCGRGVFGRSPHGLRLYYRLMGAKMGKNVIIDPSAFLSEPDLYDFGDNVLVDAEAMLNPGVADCGDFLLSPITVAAGCSIGKKCILAPGATLPKDTCMQPCSSSWQLHLAAPKYRSLCQPRSGSVPWWPLAPVGWALRSLPAIVGIIPVVVLLAYRIDLILPSSNMWSSGIRGLLDWLLQVQWLVLFMVSKIFIACFSPFIELATIIAVKSTVFRGCFRPGPVPPRRSWAALARWWVSVVLTDGQLRGVAPLINPHSELHSIILRLLGAKVGRHVFWPLSGLVTSYHDFVEVGDDVIWGAHHALITADDVAARPIVLEAGSNPLDRVVLSPGSRVGRNALLGTGSFVEPDTLIPAGCKYLGTTILEKSEERGKAPSTKPYSRAHETGAKYFLVPDWLWPVILIPLRAVDTVVRKSPFLLALFIADICTRNFHESSFDYPQPQHSVLSSPQAPSIFDPPLALSATASLAGLFYGEYDNNSDTHVTASNVRRAVPLAEFFLVLAAVYVVTDYSVKMFGVWVNIAAKWAIIGRRQSGPHRFDESSYSQRWHFSLSFHAFSLAMLERWVGTSMISWYFRLLGSSIGKDVCFLQGASPLLFREPDLTTIGDNACLNISTIRGHSNALGIFELHPCVLGDRVTLRNGVVVQGGSKLEDDSIMLERTLAMPGETINARMAMQGWPADVMVPARIRMPVVSEEKRND